MQEWQRWLSELADNPIAVAIAWIVVLVARLAWLQVQIRRKADRLAHHKRHHPTK